MKSVSGRSERRIVSARSVSRLSWPRVGRDATVVVAGAAGAVVEVEIVPEAETKTETMSGIATETGGAAKVAPNHANARDQSGLRTLKWTMIWRYNYSYRRVKR